MTAPIHPIEEQAGQVHDPALPSALPIPSLDPTDLRQLAGLLSRSGYGAAQELRRSGGPAPLDDSAPRLERLRRLFWRGATLPIQDVSDAVAPLSAAALIQSGLLEESQGGITARFQIQVYDGLFFIVDFMTPEHPSDLVLPIGPSGKCLASVTIRRLIGSALDLGCGCGIQALLMSRHAQRVTATDINPRALALTRLNFALNGISNVDTLEGSYFDPVSGRTFDLIAANLPYVITPENKHLYRDLGRPDDLPIRQNVERIPLHLNEGGFAHVMLNWIHARDQAWWEPVEDWTRQRGADAWLMYAHSHTPQEYSGQWLDLDEKEDPELYAQTRDRWVKWYEAHGIERIAFGVVTLRRRTSQGNWRCSVQVTQMSNEVLGPHILHLFECQDYLAKVGQPADLLDLRLRPHFMKLERLGGGKYLARTTRGMLIRAEVHQMTAQAISLLDGKRDLKAAVRTPWITRLIGRGNASELVAKEIYHLIELGMIAPA